jgi:aspartyl-tRNA(Asn)/glutamyl-tRNA(Gln) amidotransferase subunit C
MAPEIEAGIDIDHVARLARLDLTDEEKAQIGAQLTVILEHAAKVGGVATDDVAPTASAIPSANVFREDTPEPSITHEAAMQNAPEEEDGRFRVPKIAETGS